MIYLDGSATTKPYKEVIDVITNTLENHWGNASSDVSIGYDAKEIIDAVTIHVANDINCKPSEIIWTSGACEANSLAICGVQQASPYVDFYTTNLEHASINTIANKVRKIDNDKYGRVDLENLQRLMDIYDGSFNIPLVSVCYANSEIGVIQDIKSIAKIVHKNKGILHVDATQMYPWERIDVQALDIDLMSVSGQKMHCAKGIGFLYVRNGIDIKPIIYGSQQNGLRGGTYPTYLIAAFSKALELTRKNNRSEDVEFMRDELMMKLANIPDVSFNGPTENRLVNNISMTVHGVKADELVAMCDEYGVIVAKGSACQSYKSIPSSTLLSIGLSEEDALSTIRISLHEFNTLDEIYIAAKTITKVIEILRRY